MRPVAGLLLTGGESRRMGRPKAAIPIGGSTLAQHAADLLATICPLVLEVGPGYAGVHRVHEEPPRSGPLAAVAAGGAELRRLGWQEGAIVLAVDMPFVPENLLWFIARYGADDASAIPLAGRPQPLCARYSAAALETAGRLASEGHRSMKSLLQEVPVQWIEEREWGKLAGMEAFTDMDDEKDLALLQELADGNLGGRPPRRSTRRTEVVTVDPSGTKRRTDSLAAEEPMEIRMSGPGQEAMSVAVTMRTPGHDFDLAAGFLVTEGLVQPEDILAVKYCEIPPEEQNYNVITVKLARPFDLSSFKRNFYANSSCGICGKASLDQLKVHCSPIADGPVFPRSAILSMPDSLARRQKIFDKTGGLHAAGLFEPSGKLKALREDVGRHNACDKLIGSEVLARRLPLSSSALFVSGRLSFEIVQKAAVAGVPLVAAVSAPSSLAVETANALGMTLAGFVRGDRLNIYTHPGRIDIQG